MRFLRPFLLPLSMGCILLLLSACTLALPLNWAATGVKKVTSVDAFSARLAAAILERDYTQLQILMGRPFVMADWRAEGRQLPPEVAIVQLRNTYLSAGSGVALPDDVDWKALLSGHDPLTMWGPNVQAIKALYVTGLSDNQQTEAVLIVAQQPDGSPYWHSMLIAPDGFQPKLGVVAEHTTNVSTDADTTMPLMAVDAALATPVLVDANAPQRLLFAPGATNATMRGVLQPQEKDEYVLRALAGQMLVIEVASPGGRATLTVSTAAANQSTTPLVNGALRWSGSVPTTQEYLITLAAPVATPFELSATLDPRQAATVPTPAPVRLLFGAGSHTTTVTERVAAPERQRYLVRVAAGQTVQIKILSTGNEAHFAVQGVTDGLPLKRLENEEHTWIGKASLTQDYLITVTAPGALVEYTLQLALQ